METVACVVMVVRGRVEAAAYAQAPLAGPTMVAFHEAIPRAARPVWVAARVAVAVLHVAAVAPHVVVAVVPMAGAVTGSRDGFIPYS